MIGCGSLIVIGASTGGTEAIRRVLSDLPATIPGVLIVQHMPELYTASFAKRLDSVSALRVFEATDGEAVLPGHAYVAPGHSHLSVRKGSGGYVTELARSAPVNRHRPSVDVLFESAARCAGRNALAVLLTGMGRDGAAGLQTLRNAGAYTLCQDEASCAVFGMPRAAIELGAASEVAALADISGCLLRRLGEQAIRRRVLA